VDSQAKGPCFCGCPKSSHVLGKKCLRCGCAAYTEAPRYRIELGKLGQFIIVNARDRSLAWSGSCWVEHDGGFPTGRVHVANFASEEDARQAAEEVFG